MQDVDLLDLLRFRVLVCEDSVQRVGRKDGPDHAGLLAIAVSLVVHIKEKLVLNDVTAERAADLVLIQKRKSHAGLVLEPVIRRRGVVAVVPIQLAMVGVRPGRRRESDLRGARAERGIAVGRRDRHLLHFILKQQVGQEIQRVATDVVVLDVDSGERDVRKRGPLAVYGRVLQAVASDAGLGRDQRERAAVELGKEMHLFGRDGAGDLRIGGLDLSGLLLHAYALSHGAQLHPERRQASFAPRIDL